MVVKRGYKQTDVGVLPEDWEVKPMADLYTFQNGVNADKSAYGSGTPFINVLETITHSTLTVDRIPGRVCLSSPAENSFAVQFGDVLFNRTSETQDEVGLASVYASDQHVVFGGFVIRAQPRNNQMHYKFASYALRSPIVRFQIVARGQGVVRANIGQSELSRVKVFLPPLVEQEAIAEALSDADALIESLEQLLTKKRHIKQGAMQELLTGKSQLPGFDGEWVEKSLSELFEFTGGLSASRDELTSDGLCYLHYGDIHLSDNSYVDVASQFNDIPKLKVSVGKVPPGALLADGDIVFVDASEDEEGTSKHIVVINPDAIPFISGLHTIVAKPKGSELDSKFRRYAFRTTSIKEQFRFYAVGTKVSGISKTNIKKIRLNHPKDLEEQNAIASILSDMDDEIAALEAKLDKARQIKQGMMQELLTGRIRLV